MAPGTEFARDFCARIGPLQLGVVLVFLYFSTVIQYSIFAHGPQYYLFFFFFFFFIFRDVDLDGARHFRGKLSAIKLLSSELWQTLCGTYSDTSS